MNTRCHRPRTPADIGVSLALAITAALVSGCASLAATRSTGQAGVSEVPSGEVIQRPAESVAATHAAEVAALRNFTGDRPGAYIQGQKSLSDQILIAMGIPDNTDGRGSTSTSMSGGYTLAYGCRQHSCSEKGAVVRDSSGRVVRAGLISFKCVERKCEPHQTLTIFKNASSIDDPVRDADLDGAIKEWAEGHVPGIETEIEVLR
ncbi:hypothetical protein LDO26_11320 [Luteimonas sp. BDR2-5]|uniref:hypothetical protein n=1 Tax=Proluteimonas luteida TaxID=2878685 RepID=UPI001E37D74F|nr:hypothetical protein [Luteimonas sp. BDR2-5]MCD9028796.1 hypothetical protein [Luteimonas sp. BDR2-5]